MLDALISTRNDVILLGLRLVLAAVMWPHGAQKALGWFGGFGFQGSMAYFTKTLGIPAPLGLAAIVAEFVGPVALVLGLGGRVAALALAVVMAVAALMVQVPNGFFMNWFGNQAGEGIEYSILAFAIAVAIVIGGSGALSLDYRLASR